MELITNGPKQMVMPDKYFFPIQLSNINQNPNPSSRIKTGVEILILRYTQASIAGLAMPGRLY